MYPMHKYKGTLLKGLPDFKTDDRTIYAYVTTVLTELLKRNEF